MILDRRHRWEKTRESGASVLWTCRTCGKTEWYEKLIPDGMIDAMVGVLSRPNPYRALIGG